MEKTEAERALEFKTQGNEHFKKEEFVKAIECYTKAIELNPMEPSYFGNRAACYLGLKKYQKCIQDCDETLNLDPKFTKAWLRKGRSCFRLGRPEEAKSCLEKAIEIDPKDKAIKDELNTIAQIERMMKAANAELENQRFSNALLEVTQVLKLCPDLIEGKVKQIEILVKSGQIDKAISISNECFHECSGNTDYLYVRGLALCYNGQTEVAKKTWMEAMRLDPDNTSCRMAIKRMNRQEEAKERGNTAFKAGKYEEAVAAYTEGIEQDPLNKNVVSTLWANRGAANWKLKKLQEAIQDCDKAIELNDGYAKAYLRRGDIKMEAEQYEEAGRDFNKAHQLDPSLGARQRIKDAEIEAKKAARKDYYKILGVEKTANEGDIKKAYRKLALKWHPDKNSGSEEEKKTAEAKFKDINEAYSILSDPQKRQRFDSGADLDGMDFGGHGHGGFGDMDPNVIFRTFFGGGGGGDDPFGGGGGFPGFSFGGGGGRGGRGGGPGFTFKMG